MPHGISWRENSSTLIVCKCFNGIDQRGYMPNTPVARCNRRQIWHRFSWTIKNLNRVAILLSSIMLLGGFLLLCFYHDCSISGYSTTAPVVEEGNLNYWWFYINIASWEYVRYVGTRRLGAVRSSSTNVFGHIEEKSFGTECSSLGKTGPGRCAAGVWQGYSFGDWAATTHNSHHSLRVRRLLADWWYRTNAFAFDW